MIAILWSRGVKICRVIQVKLNRFVHENVYGGHYLNNKAYFYRNKQDGSESQLAWNEMTSTGKLFYARGPAKAKLLSPAERVVRVRGTAIACPVLRRKMSREDDDDHARIETS